MFNAIQNTPKTDKIFKNLKTLIHLLTNKYLDIMIYAFVNLLENPLCLFQMVKHTRTKWQRSLSQAVIQIMDVARTVLPQQMDQIKWVAQVIAVAKAKWQFRDF